MRNKFFILWLCVMVSGVSAVSALEITEVSTITSAGDVHSADFTFSGVFKVKGIKYEKDAVVMPVSQYKDRIYYDFRIAAKPLHDAVMSCFNGGHCAKKSSSRKPSITDVKVRKLRSKVRVANAICFLDRALLVTVGIMKKASGDMWVSFPEALEISDPEWKAVFERTMKEAYQRSPQPDPFK